MVEVNFTLKRLDREFLLRIPNVTEQEFYDLTDPEVKAELLYGEMIVHSPAGMIHDRKGTFLQTLMVSVADDQNRGEIFGPDSLFLIETDCRFAPDVAFLEQSRVPSPLPVDFDEPPDMAIEILSPSTRTYDLNEKRPAYQRAEIGELWFVDSEQQRVIVDRRTSSGYREEILTTGRLTSDVLTGFWIEVDWLWADPRPKSLTCLRAILGEP